MPLDERYLREVLKIPDGGDGYALHLHFPDGRTQEDQIAAFADGVRDRFPKLLMIVTCPGQEIGVIGEGGMRAAGWVRDTPWIACEERLPDAGVEVLIFSRGPMGLTYYDVAHMRLEGLPRDTFPEWDDGDGHHFTPTHWRPLPEPPG